MNRRTAALLVLFTWAGALGWLVARQVGDADRPSLSAERTISPSAAFYTVSRGDVQLGFASTTVDTVPTGLIVDDRVVLELPAGDQQLRNDVRTIANLTNTMALESFSSSMGAPSGRYDVNGTVEGDSLVHLEVVTETSQHSFTVRTPGPIVLTNHIPVHLSSSNQLVTGTTVALASMNPLSGRIDSVQITVAEDSVFFPPDSATFDQASGQWREARVDTVRAWRVVETAAGITAESWIDGLGRLVSRRSTSGASLDRTAFEIAFNNFRSREDSTAIGGSVHLTSAIAAGVAGPPGLASLTLVVESVNAIDRTPSLRHSWTGDTLAILREADTAMQTAGRMPYDDPIHQPFLGTELPYTWDDPYLQAQARQAADGTRNPRRAAGRIAEWVSAEIAHEAVPSVPTVLETLETRRGDVADLAAIFVAMARAVGIPTRPVSGALYASGALYVHAWAEVYLGRQWVAVDPTFGQFPAGAEYVKLHEGPGTLQDLVPRFAQLEIDVVETRE